MSKGENKTSSKRKTFTIFFSCLIMVAISGCDYTSKVDRVLSSDINNSIEGNNKNNTGDSNLNNRKKGLWKKTLEKRWDKNELKLWYIEEYDDKGSTVKQSWLSTGSGEQSSIPAGKDTGNYTLYDNSYDSNGFLEKRTVMNYSNNKLSGKSIDEWEYYPDGKIKRVTQSGTIFGTIVSDYTYMPNGKLSFSIAKFYSDEKVELTEIDYRTYEDNRETKKETREGASNSKIITESIYDNDKIMQENIFDNGTDYIKEYSYNDKGLLISCHSTLSNGQTTYYEYDDNDNLIKELVYRGDKDRPDLWTVYLYDENGNKIKESWYRYVINADGTYGEEENYSTTEYEYKFFPAEMEK